MVNDCATKFHKQISIGDNLNGFRARYVLQIVHISFEIVAIKFQLLVGECGHHFGGILFLSCRNICAHDLRAGNEIDHLDAILFQFDTQRVAPKSQARLGCCVRCQARQCLKIG